MSSDSFNKNPLNGWTLLRAGEQDSGTLTVPSRPTTVSTPQGPIRLALGKKGQARVLLPLKSDEKITGIGGTPALSITTVMFTLDGHSVRFLDLECLAGELETVFGEVVDEILERVAAGRNVLESVRTALEDFKELLFSRKGDRVTQSQIVGLVGELLYLNRLLVHSSAAWDVWRGPLGDRHDFRRTNSSLEVKTSLSAGKSLVTIHGLDQLQEPEGGELFLLHFCLEITSNGILTINALANAAMTKSGDPSKVRALIAAAGCEDISSPQWNESSFRLESETLYRVTDNFPRLVPSILKNEATPPGILDVTYKCDLALASDYACDTGQYEDVEKRFAK